MNLANLMSKKKKKDLASLILSKEASVQGRFQTLGLYVAHSVDASKPCLKLFPMQCEAANFRKADACYRAAHPKASRSALTRLPCTNAADRCSRQETL